MKLSIIFLNKATEWTLIDQFADSNLVNGPTLQFSNVSVMLINLGMHRVSASAFTREFKVIDFVFSF